MGTAVEWLRVLVGGAFFGGLMYWTGRPIDSGYRRQLRSLIIPQWAVGGFLFGFFMTFGLRILRWPLLIVLIPAVAGLVMTGVRYGRKLRELGLKPGEF